MGGDEAIESARKSGHVRLRRADRGADRRRPLHDPRPFTAALLRLPALADDGDVRPGRARGRRRAQGRVEPRDGASGRHRPVPRSPNGGAAQKIVLEANPAGATCAIPAPVDAADKPIAKGLTGRKLPLVPRVEIIDGRGSAAAAARRSNAARSTCSTIPHDLAPNVLDGDKLKPAYAKRGIAHTRMLEPALNFTYFNLDDPVVGGYTPEKIALRRAMMLGYDHRRRDPRAAQWPGGAGDADRRRRGPRATTRSARRCSSTIPAAARALLDKLRLQGPRRRRLPRDARRQAADRREGVDAQRDRPRVSTSCGRRAWTRSASA